VIKLLTLGDTSVGKTSILLQYTQGYFPKKALSTIGVDFRTKYVNLPNGKHVKVLLWDTAGQERFRNIADNYYNGSDCVLFVFDITSKSSFEMLSFWMERLKAKRTELPYISAKQIHPLDYSAESNIMRILTGIT
jgi:Ras-related protein Rab-18